MTAEIIVFAFVVFVAFTVRNAILKWKAVDKNIDKLVAIEKAQELINNELKKINNEQR